MSGLKLRFFQFSSIFALSLKNNHIGIIQEKLKILESLKACLREIYNPPIDE